MIEGKVVALILAGGQGSRLKTITENLAKPAVPYGGKYRIIDFALSNCANSGIYNVGILTQYQPLALNAHIGIGVPWDLDRRYGGVKMLPPYMSTEGGRWFKGTANAIYENIHFVDMHDPEYVLILSGDHIYKMDYNDMIKEHREKKADVTISVIEVPIEEANRFGILNTLPDGTIYEFDEKPPVPKNNLASMGIYVFNWDTLREYLVKDYENPDTNHDFGKDIIPAMLDGGLNMQSYVFRGYWKDVGTISSFWEANMDLLDPDLELNLYDDSWKIYTKNPDCQPQFISETGDVANSLLNEGCIIEGKVENSVLFTEVEVEEGAMVIDSVIFPKVKVKKGAVIRKAIVMGNQIIGEKEKIGSDEEIILVGNKDLGLFE